VDEEFEAQLPGIHRLGMEPEEVAHKVLRGIQHNSLFIFPHPEFKGELREIFGEVLTVMPDDISREDPRRLALEEKRRSMLARAKREYHAS
jgi:hypothetical protein